MADRPSPDTPSAEELDRYLSGECTEEEGACVRRYLMANPESSRILERFLRGLDHETGRPPAPDSAGSWAELRERLHDGDRSGSPQGHRQPAERKPLARRTPFAALIPRAPLPWWRRPWIAAAVVMAVASGAVVGFRQTRGVPPGQPFAESRTYATSNRERAELRLTDGTLVRIAPASRLRVAADFGTDRRDVYLEGEAYFEVVHDARRPFTVFAGNASAQDLGTEFVVRSYADDNAVQVVVREGEVALSGVGRLMPGDLGRLTADGRTTHERGVPVDAYLAWLDGRLVFRDTPLAEVLRTLDRWHDVDIRLADSALGAMPFTGELTDASLPMSIELVSRVLGLRVRRDGEVTVLERPVSHDRTPDAAAPAARPP